MFLKILLSIGVVLSISFAKDILSKTQKDLLINEQKQNKKSSDILEFDWINPISINYSYSKSDQTTPSSTSSSYSISLSQPIFRSGGIYYAIEYAKANREFLKLSTSLKKRSLLNNAYVTLINLKNIDLRIQKQKYLIKNADIDIKRKKEQYLSGVLDSSYLDNAILNKNKLQISLLDMQSQKADLIKNFKTLSSLEYKTIKLPRLKLVNLQSFMKDNLILKNQKADIKQQDYLKKMTISNYLPKVTINASYTHSRYKYFTSTTDSYKRYGFGISMPIFDINRAKKIELQKLKLLKTKLSMIDKKNSEKELYNSIIKKIKLYQKKIDISKEQERLYNSLLKRTKDLFAAGEKTSYDVQTMKNSLEATKLDEIIYKNEMDILLFDLYEHMEKM